MMDENIANKMVKYDAPEEKSALQAKFDAQKIAFAPVVFQASKALRDLGILELVRKRKDIGISAEDIAEKLQLSLYGVKVLLEVGLSSELVRLLDDSAASKYVITKTGWFLLKDELTRVNMNFVNDVCYKGMFDLQEAVTTGQPAGLKVFGEWDTIYEALSSLPDQAKKSWFEFDHFYSDVAFPEVLPLVFKNKPKSVMDVGGNTGKWTLQCLKYDKKVHLTIVDLPGQLDVAKKNIEAAGMTDRVSFHQTNLLDETAALPKGVDVIWMSQFLDCFSPEQIVSLLQRAREAMSEESRLFILETYWDRQRFEASAFSLHNTSLYFTCLANGNSKMYHSDDMKACLDKAGLVVVDQVDDIGISHTLLECRLAS